MTTRFNFPTPITYGVGARKEVADNLKAAKVSRPMVVTDEAFSKMTLFEDFCQMLKAAGLKVQIFSGIRGNPVKSSVDNGARVYKSSQCDGIVGIGGGAALDCAKAIGVLATNSGDLFDYAVGPTGKIPQQPIPYLIALPTTAGTGSEVGRSSVISDDTTKVKAIIFGPQLLPKHVFVDPELTETLPAKITAATGMDALTHLIESYLCDQFHPMCDGIALEGIRLVADNLADCVKYSQKPPKKREQHLEARGKMMMAALMGAVAFQKDLGVTHSCAHALSTVADLHHGLANAIMLPHAMKLNYKSCRNKFKDMAIAARLGNKDFIKWIKKLNKTIGIPSSLREVGVTKKQLDALVGLACKDPCHKTNPIPVSKKDFESLFKKALGKES